MPAGIHWLPQCFRNRLRPMDGSHRARASGEEPAHSRPRSSRRGRRPLSPSREPSRGPPVIGAAPAPALRHECGRRRRDPWRGMLSRSGPIDAFGHEALLTALNAGFRRGGRGQDGAASVSKKRQTCFCREFRPATMPQAELCRMPWRRCYQRPAKSQIIPMHGIPVRNPLSDQTS